VIDKAKNTRQNPFRSLINNFFKMLKNSDLIILLCCNRNIIVDINEKCDSSGLKSTITRNGVQDTLIIYSNCLRTFPLFSYAGHSAVDLAQPR
jgi:hypothetical protein